MSDFVKKAILPIAGYGTRFLPATKAYPKEMLPIIDKPLIQYAVEEAITAGCNELIFITNHAKKSIKRHFDRNIELEDYLLQKQEYKMIQLINEIIPPHATCTYIHQSSPLGLGHAVACASNLIKNEPFAVILVDDLIITTNSDNCLAQLIDKYFETGNSVIAVKKVAQKETNNYGIVGFVDKKMNGGYINAIVEKPDVEMAPSNHAVVGRYILTPTIFDCLKKIESTRIIGEIQLTTALSKLLQLEDIFALEFEGLRYDCGKKTEYFRAIVEHGLRDPEYRAIFYAVMEKHSCV